MSEWLSCPVGVRDYSGQRFGTLQVLGFADRARGFYRWEVECQRCGMSTKMDAQHIEVGQCLDFACRAGLVKRPLAPEPDVKPSARQPAPVAKPASKSAPAPAPHPDSEDKYHWRDYWAANMAVWLTPIKDILSWEQWQQLPDETKARLLERVYTPWD